MHFASFSNARGLGRPSSTTSTTLTSEAVASLEGSPIPIGVQEPLTELAGYVGSRNL